MTFEELLKNFKQYTRKRKSITLLLLILLYNVRVKT